MYNEKKIQVQIFFIQAKEWSSEPDVNNKTTENPEDEQNQYSVRSNNHPELTAAADLSITKITLKSLSKS